MTVSFTEENIEEIARQLWISAQGYKVWAFHGEMGSGKTTLIRALCTVLGAKSSFGSPTYAIINEYITELAGPVYHMDWYRLRDEEEAIMAGVEDALYSNKWCFVEWPEKAAALLPENALHIYLEVLEPGTRRVTITGSI